MSSHHGSGHHGYHHPEHRYYYGQYGPYHHQAAGAVTDDDIKSDVARELQMDSYVDASKIDISVSNGVVTLKGTVQTPMEKRVAGDDAWDIPGVMDVNNELRLSQQA